jgi:protein-S-isoprenylcysteine O-methyltransferase Ste14
MSDSEPQPGTITNFIMVAVFVWGLVLAVGVLVARKSWLGFAIVAGCTVVFLGIWKLLLVSRKRPRDQDDAN